MVLEKVSEVLEKSLNFFEKFLYCMNLKKIVLCIGCCVLSMEVITSSCGKSKMPQNNRGLPGF